MTSRITTTTMGLIALPLLFLSAPAAGQQNRDPGRYMEAEEALRVLTRAGSLYSRRPMRDILRQVHGPRPATEIGALAERLADILLSDTISWRVRVEIGLALKGATNRFGNYDYGYGSGTPHLPSFDALVRVYETRAARALADGGTDPFREAARRDAEAERAGLVSSGRKGETSLLADALDDVFRAEHDGRGLDYVRGLHHGSERPPDCRWSYWGLYPPGDGPPQCTGEWVKSMWCVTGNHLYRATVEDAISRAGRLVWVFDAPPRLPPGVPKDAAEWHRRCGEVTSLIYW